MPADTLGRPLRDLRISVTDRCNFRCVYCMPKEVFGRDYRFLERRELLSFEEMERVARVFVASGVEKIRITGGEPLLRRDLEHLIEALAQLDVDLTLTTNGSLLPKKARLLAGAGLRRVTVSLDSLDDDAFRSMNDVDFPVQRVLEGIDAAASAGLPVKVNAVIKRGVNEGSVLAMARHFQEHAARSPLHRVHGRRTLERLAAGRRRPGRRDRGHDRPGPAARACRRQLPRRGGAPLALPGRHGRDRRHRLRHAAVLRRLHARAASRRRASSTPVSSAFAATTCARSLRSGASDDDLRDAIGAIWSRRTDRYSEIRSERTVDLPKVEMSYIGG